MFVLGRFFQPGVKFEGEARSLPKSGAPESCFIRVGSGLTRKHYTRMERPVRGKHSGLFQTLLITSVKSFVTFVHGLLNSYGCN